MLELIRAIANTIEDAAGFIAADWNHKGHAPDFHDRASILTLMITLSAGHPELGIKGFIHPVYTPTKPMLFGSWGF
jgi:hypothetical protein